MRIRIIAVGKNMPEWVTKGYNDYIKRFPSEFHLELIEINAGKRTKNSDLIRIIRKEGEQMLAAVSAQDYIIALDEQGQFWNTGQLSSQLHEWRDNHQNLSFLIGGPDGLAPDCIKRAHSRWSLSPLTFPHALVRIILVEQLYRAWSILTHHPYHRV